MIWLKVEPTTANRAMPAHARLRGPRIDTSSPLTAVKVSALDIPTNATAAGVGYVAHGEALATARLVLQYSR